MRSRWLALTILLAACGDPFDPASFIDTGCQEADCKVRVLAVRADPPEVRPGESAVLTALVLDTAGQPLDGHWWSCFTAAAQGSGSPTSADCLAPPPQPFLTPIGDGLSTTLVMPPVTPRDLGLPDFTGGFYLPVRAHFSAGARSIDAIYRVRLGLGLLPNHNPRLAGLFAVPEAPDGGDRPVLVPLTDAYPPEVKRGGTITLRASFFEGSAEPEPIAEGDPRMPTISTKPEALRVNWYATAGSFSEEVTDEGRPDTVWKADKRLPTPDRIGPDGFIVDVYMVGRDERGGTDWAHRTLRLR